MPVSRREERAALDGFELEIFKLVRKRASSKQWREWLRVPLEHATADRNMGLVARLTDAGADGSADWGGFDGGMLLSFAAYSKNDQMVMALIKAGQDVNVKFGAKQKSALHVAAEHGAEKVSGTLLLAGTDPNMLDGEMQSPLHLAAVKGHHVIVRNLLLRGALPDARRELGGKTPLHLAAWQGFTPCVSALVLGGADKNSRNSSGQTAIWLAASYNRLSVVEELLAAGATVNIRDDGGWHPLDRAAEQSHVDVLRTLLRHGSSAKACNARGHTTLHCAAQGVGRDGGEIIRLLLEAGADIEAKATDDGCTPLHVAAYPWSSSSDTIYALLESGANVNARDAYGTTPLHDACYRSFAGGVEALLYWWADEKLMAENGETPADVVGAWERDDEEGSDIEDGGEQRKANDQRIRQMLARAPADRCWRRRGWLILARSSPNKVQVTQESSRSGGSFFKVPRVGCESSAGGGDSMRDEMADFRRLVSRVVGLDVEGVFRLVVTFL